MCLLQVKLVLEGKLGEQFDTFKAVAYATQVVAGINYFIKVTNYMCWQYYMYMYTPGTQECIMITQLK